MIKKMIHTDLAPAAIGCYSQAIEHNGIVYISGQIGLDPNTMTLISDDFAPQAEQVLRNLMAIIEAVGSTSQHLLKLTVYLTDLNEFAQLNTIMANYFQAPYPARAVVQVSALPKNAKIEMDAILALPTD